MEGGAFTTLVNYANFHPTCTGAALTMFLQYLPFILLLQAIAIILAEKMLMKFPRVSGKIERFYGAIVEESLFGKDPDVAEDVADSRANSEAISRQRRRNEVCEGLKRSNIIHNMYIVKNILEILTLLVFIPFNILYGLETEKNLDPSECVLDVGEMPELGLQAGGQVVFRCNGKKVSFFLWLLYVQVIVMVLVSLMMVTVMTAMVVMVSTQVGTMVLVAVCSCGSLLWVTCLRSVSLLLRRWDPCPQLPPGLSWPTCRGTPSWSLTRGRTSSSSSTCSLTPRELRRPCVSSPTPMTPFAASASPRCLFVLDPPVSPHPPVHPVCGEPSGGGGQAASGLGASTARALAQGQQPQGHPGGLLRCDHLPH